MTSVFVVPNHTDCTVITFVWMGVDRPVTVNRWTILAWAVASPEISSEFSVDPWPLADCWPIPVVMNTLPEVWCVVDPVGQTWTFPEMVPLHTEAEALTMGTSMAQDVGAREDEEERERMHARSPKSPSR